MATAGDLLAGRPGGGETLRALRAAGSGEPGGGATAAEALALGVRHAPAAGHDGDVRAALAAAGPAGMVCGHLLGAARGESGLPADLVPLLERRELIVPLVDDLLALAPHGREFMRGYEVVDRRLAERYAGG